MTIEEIFLRLGAALVVGMIIGLERALNGNIAGMRTYGLVSMGSALFMLMAVQVGAIFDAPQEILRVLGQVVMGIGFLGAGVIFYSKEEHKRVGITTAAGLWVNSGIGAACGMGLYMMGLAAAILTLLTFTIFIYIEDYLESKFSKDKKPIEGR